MFFVRPFGFTLVLIASVLSASSAQAAMSACASLLKQAARQDGFVASYPTEKTGPLKDVAFLYDNAVAIIALIACSEVKAAAHIGDAILRAQNNDRYWRDGRLRNAYPVGPVAKPAQLTGWWDAKQNRWVEDQYQVGSDTGNQAWAMLALLSLHKAGAGERFLLGAKRIGAYLETHFDARKPAGFTGGLFGGEPRPRRNGWKSTEHNTDLMAAFRLLFDATKDARWKTRSAAAETFVVAMWADNCSCFVAGTAEDGTSPNRQLALDAQVWPLMALPRGAKDFSAALRTSEKRLKRGEGFAYGEASKSVWTEGTAQVSLILSLIGRKDEARNRLAAMERNRAPDGGYYATDAGDVATGFGLETDPSQQRRYFRIPHLAALSWVVLAQQGFNPFTGTRAAAR